MKNKPIQTLIGTLSGRDAIYLDEYTHSIEKRTLTLRGEINGALASIPQKGMIPYVLTFHDLVYFEVEDIDLFGHGRGESSFDELPKSDPSRTPVYMVKTYDHGFQIEAGSFELNLIQK